MGHDGDACGDVGSEAIMRMGSASSVSESSRYGR